MAELKKLPIGIEDFEKIRQESMVQLMRKHEAFWLKQSMKKHADCHFFPRARSLMRQIRSC